VTYDALLQCICNERLPSNLRCLYTRLMLHIYVARPKVDRMRNHDSFVLDELGDTGDMAELPQPVWENDHDRHIRLKTEVIMCIKNKSNFSVPEYEPGDADLNQALMELIEEITALGYYNELDLLQKSLIPPVISLLDFSSDRIVLPVCIHMCIKFIYVSMYIFINVCVCVCVCVWCVCVVYVCGGVYGAYTHTQVYTHPHTHTPHTRTRIYVHAHVCMCLHTHLHPPTHTGGSAQGEPGSRHG
jgi:hypothetical protein